MTLPTISEFSTSIKTPELIKSPILAGGHPITKNGRILYHNYFLFAIVVILYYCSALFVSSNASLRILRLLYHRFIQCNHIIMYIHSIVNMILMFSK